MKHILIMIALGVSLISCEKKVVQDKAMKTAFVDTQKLMDACTEAKEIQAKYKTIADTKGKQLEAEISRFKTEAASFQKEAQAKGQVWAQQKGASLQKKQQDLEYAQQSIGQELQGKLGAEMDTVRVKIQKEIKSYGKEQGYTYIYGSNETVPSILYAKDKLEITSEIIKIINSKYKPTLKK